MPNEKRLHLPQLEISGFRGIDHLKIPRLGRVTLLAGKNSVGKTTVLDAVRVYASRGGSSVLYDLLRERQEFTESTDEDSAVDLDWMSLFHGRNKSESVHIFVGPEDTYQVEIQLVDDPQRDLFSDHTTTKRLRVGFQNNHFLLDIPPRRRHSYGREVSLGNGDKLSPWLTCEAIGPGILNQRQMSRLWDHVALTDDETRILKALNLVMGDDVLGVAVVGDGRSTIRRVIVRLKGQNGPIPLKSLGDGPVRLFCVALALANSRGGFLLIDEAENGIHHTVQRDLWTMILRTAHENDIQVLATTHSWDCVRGFAQAATDFEHGEGVLARLDRDERGLRAVVYSEEALKTAAEQGIEVR